MNKIIKILNDNGYEVVIGKEKVYINNSDGYIFISYDRENKKIQAGIGTDVYIMEKFVQLIVEIEKENDK